MALEKDEHGAQWEKFVNTLQIPPATRDFLVNCELKKIMVSQADKAWEIYFQCPGEPGPEIHEILNTIWRQFFGDGYKTTFHLGVKQRISNLEQLCRECWPEIVEKLAESLPSSRGWMAGALCTVNNDRLQVAIRHELGWTYLVSHGVSEKIESIILEDYGLNSCVSVVLQEEEGQQERSECVFPEQEMLENDFKTRLITTLQETKKQKPRGKTASSSRVILGKKISGTPVQLKTILEEENNVTVLGYVFNLEKRVLKNGRVLFSFCLTDKTDSLNCKILVEESVAEEIGDDLEENKWYLLRGRVQTDRYTQELTLIPQDIMETEVAGREDLAEEKRVELHLHTKMSALDGLADVGEVIKRVKRWGHNAVAITDHGVVQAFPEAYEVAARHKIKVIYGLEGYLFHDTPGEMPGTKVPTYHCILLALNQQGLRNLYELVTISHLNHFHRVPRIPKRELDRLRDGLLVGSACEAGELIRSYLRGADTRQLEEIAAYYDYLEIQPRHNNYFLLENGTFGSEEQLLEMNKKIYQLGKKLQKPVIATGDVHFLDPEDEVYRRILMAGKGFEEADNQAPLFLKTTAEMLEEFAYLGDEAAYEVVVKNPQMIASLVEEIKPIPTDFYPPEIPGAENEIIGLTRAGACSLYGDPLPEIVQKRIDKELNAIINNGFAVLYLIAHKLVKKSNEDGYLVGSRGSVGSSLVATLCGITEVNPLPPHYRCSYCQYSYFVEDGSVGSGADLPDKHCPQCGKRLVKDGHDIPFEVFLGFEGDKVPDIDLNFSGDYQPRAHKYTEELFGKDNVFRAGTIATIANKTAFGFVKNYFEEKNQYIRTAEKNRLINGCTGVKRTTGQHPGGIIVLPKGLDIHCFTPLQRPADDIQSDIVTTHFDYHSISSRLVKLDILGHDDPTVLKMLEDLTGTDCRKIPLDEPRVLSLFSSTEALGVEAAELGTSVGTLGIPEFGTKFVRQMLEDTKPQTFSELVRICGFSHGTDVWLNNAQELIRKGTAKVSEVISARDDIMIYLIYKGISPGKAFKIMEDVRKGKGLRLEDVELMKEHSVPDWYIESCQKIKYMFPKAHAVAYVMMAFRNAYYKVYYPAAFYASYFSVKADEFDAAIMAGGVPAIKRKMDEIQKKGNEATQKEEKLYSILELVLEMYLRGIHLQKVNLLASDSQRFLIREEGKALLPPLVSLQGLGQAAALGIVRARQEKPFTSREDLRIRAKLGKNVLEVLENQGCLEDLPENDQMSLF